MKVDIINKHIILDKNVTIQELIYQLESSVVDYKDYTLVVERVNVPYQSTRLEWVQPHKTSTPNPYDVLCNSKSDILRSNLMTQLRK